MIISHHSAQLPLAQDEAGGPAGGAGFFLFASRGGNSQPILPLGLSTRKAEKGRPLPFFETKPAMRPGFALRQQLAHLVGRDRLLQDDLADPQLARLTPGLLWMLFSQA